MKRYVLKQGELPGIIPGIGDVRTGEPITPFSPDHEARIKEDGRFKEYREPVTETATVKEAADADAKKTATGGKDGK